MTSPSTKALYNINNNYYSFREIKTAEKSLCRAGGERENLSSSNRNNSYNFFAAHTEISFPFFPFAFLSWSETWIKPRRRHKKHRRDISCFVYIISCHIPSRIKRTTVLCYRDRKGELAESGRRKEKQP